MRRRRFGTTDYEPPPPQVVVPPTFFQQPTMAPGEDVEVVGESHYAEALERIAGGRTADGCAIQYVTAQLVREPNNPHDSDAVAVWIGAEKIGHISAYDAEELHEPIARVQRLQGRASCRALLTGGWDRGLGDRGAIGVTLDLHHEYVPWTTYDPIIIGRQRCTVTGVDDQQMLSGVLGDQTKRYGLAHLSRDADHRITVWINGVEIGRFTANMSSRYTPFLNRLQAHCPLTCTAVVERQPNSAIKVWAKLPQAKDFPLFGP